MVYDAVKSNISVSKAINLSLRKFIFVFIGAILYVLIVLIRSIALIIPGIFFLVMYAFYSYAILLDNEKIISSFKKSWRIVTGNWWKIFGLILIFLIPLVAIILATNIAIATHPEIVLVLDFTGLLLSTSMLSVFTIAYI